MIKPVRIALDVMGGDHGPEVIVPGAARALRVRRDMEFVFFGDASRIRPLVDAEPGLSPVSRVHHTDVSVPMDAKPSQALRAGRRTSSMWLAIEAVKKNEADVAVSAGNTGALMAMAKTCLHMMPQIGRPAIAAVWPTLRGESIVLDLGATIGADARHLVDLAVMGSEMARIVLSIERPVVGLLNIGVEEVKGNEEVRLASRLLRECSLPTLTYHGFVEGDDIGKGTVDVVVTEGFTGNIALKTAEGTASQMGQHLREALGRDLASKLGYFLARRAFAALKAKMDPRNVNGGVFLGLNGVVIKSHGGSDAVGTARALEVGYIMVRHQLLTKIRDSLPRSRKEFSSHPMHEPAGAPVAARLGS
ncbi:MAG: phosphate acyltransferase PlsX [Beijerinckiaceae bacterium]|nr:phosphate acyltransferase PlsX [Beijerinckiaceae bacterium]MCI0736455.1 phosphate acyltransferase PlsX [Beijerinckiaceae bacterium]